MTDKRYKIGLEVITPLHVGTGNEHDWIRGADFAQKDGKVFVIDIRKAIEKGIDVSNLFVTNDQRTRNGLEVIDSRRLESIAKYIFISPQSTNNEIKTCLRNQFLGTPVVAGSSIKGAIRSALFKHLGENELKQQKNKQQKDNQLVKDVFGDMNEGTDFMRFIRISDIEIPKDNKFINPDTILVNTKLFNLQNNEPDKKWHGGWKNGKSETTRDFHPDEFNTLYECIKPGRKGDGAIILGRSAFDLLVKKRKEISYADKKKGVVNYEINELFKVINKATKEYLEKEEAFFDKYNEADHADLIIESIKELKALIPDENADTGSYCLLKMSAGVGFHAITGNWVYDNFIDTGTDNGKKNKKSRKIAIYKGNNPKPYLTGYELMGFVKLRIISEKDVEYEKLLKESAILLNEGQWEEAYKKVCKAKTICPSRNEHASILEQCETIKKEAALKAEEQKKLNAYNEYIREATEFMSSKKWIEAKQKAKLAEELSVKQTEHYKIIEQCEKAIKYNKPLSEVINNKMSVGNIIGTTKTWIRYQTFGEKEFAMLKEVLNNIKEKELKKKYGELNTVIGELWANRLLKELFPSIIEPTTDETFIIEEYIEEKENSKTESAPDITINEIKKELSVEVEEPEEEPQLVHTKKEGFVSTFLKWLNHLF